MKNLIIRVLNKLGLLRFFNINGSASINGKRVIIPVLGGIGIENLNISEIWLIQVLIRIKPFFKDLFLDIGVNIGQTLIKTHTVFDNMHYIGFEPNSICINYVNDLITINNFTNCKLIPAGISNETQILKLNFYSDNKSDSTASIIEKFRPQNVIDHSVYVPVFDFSLLTQILNKSKSAILKIDVEGAELEVLQGLLPWISECQPIILIEVLPVYNKENIFRLQRQQQLENILGSLNYKMSRIDKKTIQLNEIDEIGIHANLDDSDYIFYPANLKEYIHKCF